MPLRGSEEWPVLALDVELLSEPRASAKKLAIYIVCGKRGHYDEPEVKAIVQTYVASCSPVGLDPLLVVSQLILESDNLTSDQSDAQRLDPVGIASRIRSPGYHFRSWPEVA